MYFDKPIKMQRSTHYGNNYWKIFSKKMNRIACFFSNLEYHNFLTLEMNPEVAYMCEQPLEIEVMIGGRLERSIPDFWVRYDDGSEELQEVKSEESLTSGSKDYIRTREQLQKQKLWCEENSIGHAVRSEKEIYAGEYTIDNYAVMASRVRRYQLPEDIKPYRDILIGYLKACKKADIRMLVESGSLPFGSEMNFLCYMHYEGTISMGINDRPLDYRTEVTLFGK